MQSSRTAPSAALRNDERTSTKRSALLPSLVTLQVALSLVLVAGAGLFVRTLSNLQHVDAGFTADGVFVVDLLRGQEPSPHRLLEVVRHVPGVVTAGVTTHTPLDGSSWSEAIVPAGQPLPERDNARIIGAGPDFLETLAIPLVAGRAFRASDVAGAPAVAVINERYAEQHFPRQNPLGQHLVSSLMGQPGDLQVVGVVRNTVASGLRRQPPPIVYVSFAQFGSKLSPQLAIRATGATAAVAEAVRAALQAQLPSMPVEVRPLSSQIGSTIVQERMVATVATGFGVLALVLSSVGLYGLLAYNVARRSREIGIRMALGATASGVIGAVVLRGIRLVAAGVVLGFPAVWLASRAVASMLFGVKPVDPFTLVGAVVLLASSALVASYVPARRASHIDPLRALNCE